MSHTKLILSLSIATFVTLALAGIEEGKADLRSDLGEVIKLIPKRRIGYIAARYYIFDEYFRHSVIYIRSGKFEEIWQQIRETKEFKNIVDYVSKYSSGYDFTKIIDNIPNQLRSFKLPSKVPVRMILQRNLSTFLKEVVQSLPQSNIAGWMSRKVRESKEFETLYKALRDSQFRLLVHTARNSRNLSSPIMELRKHFINVDDLIRIVYQILEWGPAVN